MEIGNLHIMHSRNSRERQETHTPRYEERSENRRKLKGPKRRRGAYGQKHGGNVLQEYTNKKYEHTTLDQRCYTQGIQIGKGESRKKEIRNIN